MSSGDNQRPRLGLSIGARLTLWSCTTTLIACGLLSVMLYYGLASALLAEVDSFVEGELSELASIVTDELAAGGGFDRIQDDIRHELGSRRREDLIFRAFDDAGNLLFTSNTEDPLPLRRDPATASRLDANQTRIGTQTTRSGESNYRTAYERVSNGAGRLLIIEACYRLDGTERSLAKYRLMSILALAVVAVAAVAGGRFVAGRSLRPVELITNSARRIESGNLYDRLPRSGNGDELDQLAETLNEMLGRIQTAMQRVHQFTADASHEIRTPLAALRGATEVALSRPRSAEELRETMETSIEHFSRLGRIADDLLFLASADAGKMSLHRHQSRLDELIRGAVELYLPMVEERGLSIDVGPLDSVIVSIDVSRIKQVLINLLDNAVKYNTSGRSITIRLENHAEVATLTVKDDGPGIPDTELPRIFDRFYRVDRARAGSVNGGVGLGLAICRTIVEAHGGTITLKSRGGVEAIVRLPTDDSVDPP